MHTLTKFLVHTTNVQCVHRWDMCLVASTYPNGNPVPSRRSIACFPQFPPQQQSCVPSILSALLALGVHKLCPSDNPHRKKSHGVRSGDLGDHGKRGTSSKPTRPIQRCG
ncbi:hypothetical protein AVEN_157940-1 [Araneus ventricosus]|uniref:Uncharacterized protein n=1 Tax=Araneus ventricosus TaxID=182803 RepID=A0A4Y2NGE5_ARAVE|nr:hypothetical protein AVEN_157940-1 [Araneus ventricosus]